MLHLRRKGGFLFFWSAGACSRFPVGSSLPWTFIRSKLRFRKRWQATAVQGRVSFHLSLRRQGLPRGGPRIAAFLVNQNATNTCESDDDELDTKCGQKRQPTQLSNLLVLQSCYSTTHGHLSDSDECFEVCIRQAEHREEVLVSKCRRGMNRGHR
ncbi:hypothetical protein BH11VER1_BH11VER1_01840 [soil metagenome]